MPIGDNRRMIDATLQNFEAEVLAASMSTPVLLDIWAEWCGPCKQLGPVLEQLETEYAGRFILAKLDADKVPQIAGQLSQMLGVRSIPLCVLFKGGQPVDAFVGAQSAAQIRQFLDKHVPSEGALAAEEELSEAEALLESGDTDAALAKLADALAQDPGNDDARADYARLLIATGGFEQAAATLEEPLRREPRPLRFDALRRWLDAMEFVQQDERGNWPIEQFDAAIAQDKRDFDTRFAKAQVLMAEGEWTASMAELAIARQNQLATVEELHRRVQQEGLTLAEFRDDVRNQVLLARLREREIEPRIKVSDSEVEAYIREQTGAAAGQLELNLAMILVAVPEGASATETARLQVRADEVARRARGGEDFAKLAQEYSDANNRGRDGGVLGLRPADRYPELFVRHTQRARVGDIVGPVKSDAGFHLLKVLERQQNKDLPEVRIPQTHARHILLRVGPTQSEQVARERAADFRRRIQAGQASFEELARQHSQDDSAAEGGDLGWVCACACAGSASAAHAISHSSPWARASLEGMKGILLLLNGP